MKPLSFSELTLWERNPSEWSRRYLLGIKDKPTPSMIRGKDIHAGIEEEGPTRYEDPTAYFPDEVRANRRIVGEIRFYLTNVLEDTKYEVKVETEIDSIPTIGFWDAYAENTQHLYEFKTTRGYPANYVAGYREQLSFYTLQHQSLYNVTPKHTTLIVGSTTKGNTMKFEITLEPEELAEMRHRIRYMWSSLGEDKQLLRLETIYDKAGNS